MDMAIDQAWREITPTYIHHPFAFSVVANAGYLAFRNRNVACLDLSVKYVDDAGVLNDQVGRRLPAGYLDQSLAVHVAVFSSTGANARKSGRLRYCSLASRP